MKTINKKVVGYLQMATTEITSPEDNFIWIDGGHVYVRLAGVTYQLDQQSGGGSVDSVNGQTGVVEIDTDDVPEGTTNK